MAKKKARKQPARGAGRSAQPRGFEIEESLAAEASPVGASLEQGLIMVTFVVLVIGLILAQMDLSASYGKGLL